MIQVIFRTFFAGSDTTLPLIAGVVVVMVSFQPTSVRVRQFIDHQFYGIDIDYYEVAKRDKRQLRLVANDDGETFGEYGQLQVIGRGGMGVVYRAMHPQDATPIAIKVLKDLQASDDETTARFRREAGIMKELVHPNIVRVYELGELNNTPYLTMEYVEGGSLGDALKERSTLPFDEALPIFADIAAALDYAHGRGIVHRDIKPANVMLDTVREDRHAVLMDFGIAHVAAATRMTQTDGMLGTLDYISPEQIRGEKNIDRHTDIYSFGILVYQTLTGETPFHRDNAGATIMAHLMQPPPDIRKKVPNLRSTVAYALIKAMDKQPENRFGSAQAFVDAMRG